VKALLSLDGTFPLAKRAGLPSRIAVACLVSCFVRPSAALLALVWSETFLAFSSRSFSATLSLRVSSSSFTKRSTNWPTSMSDEVKSTDADGFIMVSR